MPEQSITIPLSSTLSLEDLLEIAQSITDELHSSIQDAGADCEIDELDVSVQYIRESK